MNDQTILVLTAIICITLIYCTALSLSIDGAYLLPIVAVISGLTGYVIPGPYKIH